MECFYVLGAAQGGRLRYGVLWSFFYVLGTAQAGRLRYSS